MTTEARSVVILDDDDAVRGSLREFFEDRGWRVKEAREAEAALAIVRQERPDGIVVDVRLPGMDGNTFILAAVREHPGLACVICTGSPQYEPPPAVRALPQVARAVFCKPVMALDGMEATLRAQIAARERGGGAHD